MAGASKAAGLKPKVSLPFLIGNKLLFTFYQIFVYVQHTWCHVVMVLCSVFCAHNVQSQCIQCPFYGAYAVCVSGEMLLLVLAKRDGNFEAFQNIIPLRVCVCVCVCGSASQFLYCFLFFFRRDPRPLPLSLPLWRATAGGGGGGASCPLVPLPCFPLLLGPAPLPPAEGRCLVNPPMSVSVRITTLSSSSSLSFPIGTPSPLTSSPIIITSSLAVLKIAPVLK